MSSQVFFGSRVIQNGQVISQVEANERMSVDWAADPKHDHTVMMFDMDTQRPLVHFLEVNIPGNQMEKGQIIRRYRKPSPPSGEHHYYIDVFTQTGPIQVPENIDWTTFDIPTFVNQYGLKLADRTSFSVMSASRSPGLGAIGMGSMMGSQMVDPPADPPSRRKGPYPPSEQQKKFCDCVLKVEQKGGAYNPYAVCAHSTGTSYHWCSEQVYNFETMSLSDLQAYAALHNLPTAGTREDLLRRISEMKQREHTARASFPNQLQTISDQLGRSLSQLPQQMGQSMSQLPQQFGQTLSAIPQQLGHLPQELGQQFGQTLSAIPQQLGQTFSAIPQQFV